MYGDSWLPECGGVKVSAGHALPKVSERLSMRDFRASQIFTSAVGILYFLYRLADYLGPHGNGALDEVRTLLIIHPAKRVCADEAEVNPSRIFRLEPEPQGVVQSQRGDNGRNVRPGERRLGSFRHGGRGCQQGAIEVPGIHGDVAALCAGAGHFHCQLLNGALVDSRKPPLGCGSPAAYCLCEASHQSTS